MLHKKAIITLTRGYTNFLMYELIIKRNKNIDANLIDKSIDIIIFNEGNISTFDQEDICNETPNLNIKFVTVQFPNDKESLPNYDITRERLGYKHMCHFWFIDSWKYLEQYDTILRIDEDCMINFNIDSILNKINNKWLIFGHLEEDLDYVTIGLNEFTLDFLKNNGYTNNQLRSPITGPYTNVIAMNLKLLRENEIIKSYIQDVDKSNCIYMYRWGDLPLWGELLYYIIPKDKYEITTDIKYFHGSHNRLVN